MSRRNVILLIIMLAVVVAVVFGTFYFQQPASQTPGAATGINFLANFIPFGKSKTTPAEKVTPPANLSESVPTNEISTSNLSLKKVSGFPIAGFGVFMKERFKEESLAG